MTGEIGVTNVHDETQTNVTIHSKPIQLQIRVWQARLAYNMARETTLPPSMVMLAPFRWLAAREQR